MILKAAKFAQKAHANQVRKFSGVPYIFHIYRVAGKIATLDVAYDELVAAAWLHDTVEDCNVTFEDITREFGMPVMMLVNDLTNVFTKENYPNYNRQARKDAENERLAKICNDAKIIKLADRLDNFIDIPQNEEFKVKYAKETEALLSILAGAHEQLEEELKAELMEFWKYVDP